MNISKGRIIKPGKVVLFGPEGIGKTTLASKAPDPLFIDTEDGTKFLDVKRVDPAPKSWNEIIAVVKEAAATPGICKTLVIDTADWAELLCVDAVCTVDGKKVSLESFGYGKGYTYLSEKFAELLRALDMVVESGKNVIVTAHAKMRKVEQPDEKGAYDHWELKLSKQVAPMVKEWCDALLFANYKTFVTDVGRDGKGKATGGRRVLYTNHTPYWDAKNRHGLGDCVDMDYAAIASLFCDGEAQSAVSGAEERPLLAELKKRMLDGIISDGKVKALVLKKKLEKAETPVSQYADTTLGWLIDNWDKALPYLI